MTYKTTLRSIVITGIVALMVLPAVTFAIDPIPADEGRANKGAGSGEVCERIRHHQSKVAERGTTFVQKHEEHRARLEAKKAERKTEAITRRAAAETRRDEHFAMLEEKAATGAQEVAVAEFIAAVETLIAERDETMEAAKIAFEAKVAELHTAKIADAEVLRQEHTAAVSAAFERAVAACDAGADPAEIRRTLKDELQPLQGNRAQKSGNDVVRAAYQEAQNARKAAFTAAQETFRAGMTAAKAELRSAFE